MTLIYWNLFYKNLNQPQFHDEWIDHLKIQNHFKIRIIKINCDFGKGYIYIPKEP